MNLEERLSVLSSDEKSRAARFHFDRHRHAFIMARYSLRSILGRHLEAPPQQVQFVYGKYGKPAVKQPADALSRKLFFNLTHSHEIALVAVTPAAEIGIDVEFIHDVEEGVARRYFSPREVASLEQLPADSRREAFFNCWTRKEACVKAVGNGLSLPLDGFDVSLVPGEPARILEMREPRDDAATWTLLHLTPESGYIGALAIRARNLVFELRDFDRAS